MDTLLVQELMTGSALPTLPVAAIYCSLLAAEDRFIPTPTFAFLERSP
jgi:hypothetical protein